MTVFADEENGVLNTTGRKNQQAKASSLEFYNNVAREVVAANEDVDSTEEHPLTELIKVMESNDEWKATFFVEACKKRMPAQSKTKKKKAAKNKEKEKTPDAEGSVAQTPATATRSKSTKQPTAKKGKLSLTLLY